MAENNEKNYDLYKEIEDAKNIAIEDIDAAYDEKSAAYDEYYRETKKANKEYADEQIRLQNEKTELAIEMEEQNKAQAKKGYTKEQSGAYTDWQKQSNEYGANAEQMAAMGMAGTGYSESAQVSMYNQYQTRIAIARETFDKAILHYDNAIKSAKIQNDVALAEIALNTLQQELKLSLESFNYRNALMSERITKKAAVEESYLKILEELSKAKENPVISKNNTDNSGDSSFMDDPFGWLFPYTPGS